MNAKYKITFYENFNSENDEGIAFGENPGEIVNNVFHYYGEDDVEEITISLTEDYNEVVLPLSILQDYFKDSKN